MRHKRFLRWLRSMLAASFGCLSAVGCDPGQLPDLTPPSAGVDVTPATGGGGTIEPAEIPINVRVTVERQQSPIIINDRDEFADACDCGCERTACDCTARRGSPDSAADDDRRAPEGTACNTWIGNGNLYWMADGVQWYLEDGGSLADGQSVQGGRFQMRSGTVYDLTGSTPRQTTNTAPQYRIECVNGTCRRVRVN